MEALTDSSLIEASQVVLVGMTQNHDSCCVGHGNNHYQSLAAMSISSGPACRDSGATPHQRVASPRTAVKAPGCGKNRKRKRTGRACLYCQKLHLSCDEMRPCGRCVNAGRCDLCKDGKRKRRGRKRKNPAPEVANDEDGDVDVETVDYAHHSHSDCEDIDEEASSSSVTQGPMMSPERKDDSSDDSVTVSVSPCSTPSQMFKRRAVGSGPEPCHAVRPVDLFVDPNIELEVASLLVGLNPNRLAVGVQ